MNQNPPLPYPQVRVAGSANERGRAYGAWLGDRLSRFLEVELFQWMKTEHGLEREEMNRFAETCIPYIQSQTPCTWQFLEGLSAVSGMSLLDLGVILTHEEYYHGKPLSHHCTGFAVGPRETTDGQTYIGQTWDWMYCMIPHRHLLHQTTTDGLRIFTYAFPGLWASAGMNSQGVALVWTGAAYELSLKQGAKPRAGVPSYALIAEILEQTSFAAAVDCAMRTHHAGWFLFLLAGKNGELARIDGSPVAKGCRRPPSIVASHWIYTDPEVRRLAHGEPVGTELPANPRYDRMCKLLLSQSGELTRAKLFALQADHAHGEAPAAICCHSPGADAGTMEAFLFSPSLNQAWFTPGPPCQNQPQQFIV
ncbi:MAG: hypothetical protein PCFJNLEI_02439 [Verrucomicrobiae bacterium]|nr:hypothetical protein [Verrucomicrobiae bacterium]